MTSEIVLKSLLGLIRGRLSDLHSCETGSDFDPRIYRRVIGESIGCVVVGLAQNFLKDDLPSNSNAFKEMDKANVLRSVASDIKFHDINTLQDIERLEEIYEKIISIDFPLTDYESIATETSISQKMQGSFYTPQPLAFNCVKTCLDLYIEKRLAISDFSSKARPRSQDTEKVVELLCNTTVVDLSCGVARFLVAVVRYVQHFVAKFISATDKRRLALCLSRNLYGYDVDPIALGIARLRLVKEITEIGGPIDNAVLFGNLAHVNPLIARDGEYNAKVAVRNYYEGFLYSPSFGRPDNFSDLAWDLVVGNPPWEKIRLEERSFFKNFMSGIVLATSKSERKKEIDHLKVRLPQVYTYFEDMSAHINNARKRIQQDPIFAHSSHGELNTCALFTELSLHKLKAFDGVGGLLVKTSILTHYAHRKLFSRLQSDGLIAAVYDFVNRARYFPIDSRERFSWLVFGGRNETITLAVNLESIKDMNNAANTLNVSPSTLELLNPDTGMLPSVHSPESFKILVDIYEKNSVFSREYPQAKFGRLVHLTTHSVDIHRKDGIGRIPILEGKFIDRYDGRFAEFDDMLSEKNFVPKATAQKVTRSRKEDPYYLPQARYFIDRNRWEQLTVTHREQWSIFWRSTTSASNKRTCIATILPHGPAIQSLQMLQLKEASARDLAIVLATMNSKVFDYLVRNKLSGIDLTQNVIKQLAVPSRSVWYKTISFNNRTTTLENHVISRVAQMLKSDARLESFIGGFELEFIDSGSCDDVLDEEIDILVSMAYGLTQHQIEKILKHFIS